MKENSIESLTLLYLQNQDVSACTPEELVALYFQAYEKIEKEYKAQCKTHSEKDWLV